ncbi:MAG: HK97 family phage prohead protease [Phycisphaerae bacterium]|jgi:phage head maturation protease
MRGTEAKANSGAPVERLSAAARIEIAQAGQGRRAIRGVANTFRLMRTGRLIHPAAVEKWLANRDDARPVPLLAQHGFTDGFARIGQVTALRVDRKAGLIFEAVLAEGIALADDAWTLIRQGMAPAVSIGWSGQPRLVRDDEPELDEWVGEQFRTSGRREAWVFFSIDDLIEISLVDVGDDADARLAARAQGAAVDELRQEIAGLRAEVDQLRALGGSAEIAALVRRMGETFGEFLDDWKDAALEMLASDELIGEAAADLAAVREERECGASAGDELGSLWSALQRLGESGQ